MVETTASASGSWPPWARRLATAALLFHLAAILVAAFAAAPASPLERWLADGFSPYYGLIDQGYSYRYYTPEPPPTPVVTARLEFADGRPEQTLRLPDRGVRPRLLYQRQLALANALYADHDAGRRMPGPEGRRPSQWAPAYARHICQSRGASKVTLLVQLHMVPSIRRMAESRDQGERIDFDAEEFYTAPERIGVFTCDGL